MVRRAVDLCVIIVAMAFGSWPFMNQVIAASDEDVLLQSSVRVEQKVKSSTMISHPAPVSSLNVDRNGRAQGEVMWEVYTSADKGFKIALSSDGSPAMRSTDQKDNVEDYGATPSAWSVGNKDRAFGFTVTGDNALGMWNGGQLWRGFNGSRSVEAARRRQGPVATNQIKVKLSAEMGKPLPGNADVSALVIATAFVNS